MLDALHLELWKIFKPDDHAQNQAVQTYRAKHPAANHAAEAIVIYSLNRKGARASECRPFSFSREP